MTKKSFFFLASIDVTGRVQVLFKPISFCNAHVVSKFICNGEDVNHWDSPAVHIIFVTDSFVQTTVSFDFSFLLVSNRNGKTWTV